MHALRLLAVVAACVALASCATTQPTRTVVCRKEGNLEVQARFEVASASVVEREEGLRREITGGRVTGEGLREPVSAETRAALDRIPALRDRTRIVPP